MGIDLELTGSELEEIDGLLGAEGTEGLTDPVVVPEVPENPATQPGDLWVLGNHQLLCGDARSPKSFDRVLGRAVANTVFTDPPYNVITASPHLILGDAGGLRLATQAQGRGTFRSVRDPFNEPFCQPNYPEVNNYKRVSQTGG